VLPVPTDLAAAAVTPANAAAAAAQGSCCCRCGGCCSLFCCKLCICCCPVLAVCCVGPPAQVATLQHEANANSRQRARRLVPAVDPFDAYDMHII
jgi:hypothetical protein